MRFSLMTLIAALFAVIMLFQIWSAIGDAPGRIEGLSIERGDQIRYDYTARVPDGRVYDTTIKKVAERAHFTQGLQLLDDTTYARQTATVNASAPGLRQKNGETWGSAADAAVEESFVGGTVRIDVGPEFGPGTWNPWHLSPLPRDFRPSIFQREVFLQEGVTRDFSLAAFDEAFGPLEEGKPFRVDAFRNPWGLMVVDLNPDNRSVTIRQEVQDGDEFFVPGFGGTVTVAIDEAAGTLTRRITMQEGTTFVVAAQDDLHNAGFDLGSYLVRAQNETHIIIEHNPGPDPRFVGLPLEIEIKIRSKVAQDKDSA